MPATEAIASSVHALADPACSALVALARRASDRPRHDAGVNQPFGHRVAQQLDDQHFDQAVHLAMATAAGHHLRKQHLLRELRDRELCHRHAQQGRQAVEQRVLVVGA